MAEEQCSEPILPTRGVVAGCPMATCMAKIFLWDIVEQLVNRRLPASVSTWVDDLGMDTVARHSRDAAVRVAQCYRVYTQALVDNGLALAKDKSGFLVSSREMKVALAKGMAPRESSNFECRRPKLQVLTLDLGRPILA